MKARFVAVLLVLMVGAAVIAPAQTQTVYNSIPKPLPANVASEGPEAYAFSELGDAIALTTASGTIGQVTVVMSSWACQNGNWTASNCITTAGATFSQPLTINIYSVAGNPPTLGTLLASLTQTFNIPYRPSSDPSKCPADYAGYSRWFNSKDKNCYHGFAVPVTVNFSGMHVAIPSDGKVIVTVSFNTSHFGPHPLGENTACFGTSAGCPYDSLNIGTDTTAGFSVSSPLDPQGLMVNYTLPNNSCTGTIGTLVLTDDTGCWDGYHPEIQVQANTNSTGNKKGQTP